MPQASTDESTATLRVLVVDDCAALRHGVRAALERAGLSVVGEAADGAQALAQAAAQHPDVVLMDLNMPVVDGIEATVTLRRQQPETPVVLWTGEDDARLSSAIHRSGARAGLPKGARTADLVARLRSVCGARAVARG
jgi:DNA-binding NarL/FixJ family response regulator